MQELIASYLIQKRECSLPLLGHFRIKTKSAEYDRADQQFFPPADEIIYGEFTGKLSGDLITYIATHKNISQATAEAEINDWCHKARKHVDLGNKIIFDSIGSLQKD